MIKAIIIEEQNLFRASLKSLINEFDFVNVENDIESIDRLSKDRTNPLVDLVVLSLYSFDQKSIALIDQVQNIFTTAKVLILSDEVTRNELTLLSKEGVFAFFSKNANPFELKKMLIGFDKYETITNIKIDFFTRESIMKSSNSASKLDIPKLTNRELEVLRLVCEEKTNTEISKSLGLSVRTVESFRRKMISKMGCKNIIGVILKTLDPKQTHFKAKDVNIAS